MPDRLRKSRRRKRSTRKSSGVQPTAPGEGEQISLELHKQLLEKWERAFNNGHTAALWDLIVHCEQGDVPKPTWAKKALIQHAREQVVGSQRKMGRRSNLFRDAYVYVSVNDWTSEAHSVSFRQAYVIVAREVAEEFGENLTPEAIRAAYLRAKNREETQDFYYSTLLDPE